MRTIWLDRVSLQDQAKSWVKWLKKRKPSKEFKREHRQAFAERIREDRRIALEVWHRRGPVMMLTYEGIKRNPMQAAELINKFLDGGLDVARMASAVRDQETKCRKGFLEDELEELGPPLDTRHPTSQG